MIPSTTCRWSRNGRPRCPSEEGSNGSIRDHWESLNNAVRDTRLPSPNPGPTFGRHALARAASRWQRPATHASGADRLRSLVHSGRVGTRTSCRCNLLLTRVTTRSSAPFVLTILSDSSASCAHLGSSAVVRPVAAVRAAPLQAREVLSVEATPPSGGGWYGSLFDVCRGRPVSVVDQ